MTAFESAGKIKYLLSLPALLYADALSQPPKPSSLCLLTGLEPFNLLFPDKTALRGLSPAGMDDFQLQFEFG